MDGFVFNESKPIKDFKEGYNKAKAALSSFGNTDATENKAPKEEVKDADIKSKFKSMWGRFTKKDTN
jgi:hypothetical protein